MSEENGKRKPIQSREYKVILNVEQFKDRQAGIQEFLELIKALSMAQHLDLKIDLDEKRERSTRYIDTPNSDLWKRGLVLRQRLTRKPGKPDKTQFTLKYRSSDRYITEGLITEPEPDDSKFEEDIINPCDFVSKFSYSMSVTFESDHPHLPVVASAANLFPILGEIGLAQDSNLKTVRDLVVNEIVVEAGEIDFGKDKAEAEFNFWYEPECNELLIAEFSFKYGHKKEIYPPEVVKKAKQFFETLAIPAWYDPMAKTKTAYIYGDITEPCPA